MKTLGILWLAFLMLLCGPVMLASVVMAAALFPCVVLAKLNHRCLLGFGEHMKVILAYCTRMESEA